jgi:hypothetical protein
MNIEKEIRYLMELGILSLFYLRQTKYIRHGYFLQDLPKDIKSTITLTKMALGTVCFLSKLILR